MSDPDVFTVAWICALATELAAARAILDEVYPDVTSVSKNDQNSYTLGRVGKHRIIITVLPSGQYGLSSATSVVRDMLHTFTNLRFGLMVGIGGGAPTAKNDIRLGDVVVSEPTGGSSGVIQYDFGKAIQEQEFLITAHSNKPPWALRAAVNRLRGEHDFHGHHIQENIATALTKGKRLASKYKRPSIATDRLYVSTKVHPQDDGACSDLCGNGPSDLVSREERTSDDDDPTIHYGLIASANTLMKDASVRDALAKEKDVLCFEMEAAGLMDNFPCLVIRGICDYSDSHKNKEWQGYAAMTAAAYAKELMSKVEVEEVQSTERLTEVVSGISTEIKNMKGEIKDAYRHGPILQWLSPTDFPAQHADHSERRGEDTGLWFLEHPVFLKWLQDSDYKTLFCPGMPGAGKTTMAAAVIDHLMKTTRDSDGLAYIYCDYKQREVQNTKVYLEAILRQLTQAQKVLPKAITKLYDQHQRHGTRLNAGEIFRILQEELKRHQRVYLVVDALDECTTEDQFELIRKLQRLQADTSLHILVTSRFVPNIEEQFDGLQRLEIRASDEDVKQFIVSQMQHFPRFIRKHSTLQSLMQERVAAVSSGMFMLARLHIQALQDTGNEGELVAALDDISEPTRGAEVSNSEVLDQLYRRAYDKTIDMIQSQRPRTSARAERALSWILYARRSLTPEELCHALAVQKGTTSLDHKRICDVEDIVSSCAGLIIVDGESDVVRLVHYTAQEYFERSQWPSSLSAEEDIASTCLTYLSFDVFRSGACSTEDEYLERRSGQKLSKYASCYWGHHTKKVEEQMCELTCVFLNHTGLIASAVQIECDVERGLRTVTSHDWEFRKRAIYGLHITARFGLSAVADRLLEFAGGDERFLVNMKEPGQETPLLCAARYGQHKMVQYLLSKGADINAQHQEDGNALQIATRSGNEQSVQLLLKSGMEANMEPSERKWGTWMQIATPLQLACFSGKLSIAKLLLDSSTGKKFGIDETNIALVPACQMGHEDIIRLLIDRGADVNAMDRDGSSSLYHASLSEDSKKIARMMKMLLSKGADMNAQTAWDESALCEACQKGHDEVVSLLTDSGAERDYVRAFRIAIAAGHERVVRLFLQDGVNIDAQAGYDEHPFSLAVSRGHKDIAMLLLEHGVDIDAQAGYDEHPFLLAVRYGHKDIAMWLLEHGVDIDAQAGYVEHPFLLAVRYGHKDIAMWLLDQGADVNVRNGDGNTALQLALAFHQDLVEFLLEKGAKVDVLRGSLGTPLDLAWRNEELAKLLLANGANIRNEGERILQATASWGDAGLVRHFLDQEPDVKRQQDLASYALPEASAAGNQDISELLLERGAQANATFDSFPSALQEASRSGHENIVQLLLEKEIDVNISGGGCGTALQLASERGHEGIVRLLLERGANAKAKAVNSPSILSAALRGRCAKIIRMLLDHGATVSRGDLRRARDEHCSLEILRTLIAAGADTNEVETLKMTADGAYYQELHLLLNSGARPEQDGVLQDAAMGGDNDVIELLLEHGVDINQKDSGGFTAMFVAFSMGQWHTVELLLKRGADINRISDMDTAAFMCATASGQKPLVLRLLELDADIDLHEPASDLVRSYRRFDQPGRYLEVLNPTKRFRCRFQTESPLEVATVRGHFPTVKILLDHHADIDSSHALQAASGVGQEQIARLLLEHGATVDNAALREAAAQGHVRILRMLLDHYEGDITRDNLESGMIHAAAEQGDVYMVEYLLSKGAKPDSTSLWVAAVQNQETMVHFLLDLGVSLDGATQYGSVLQGVLESGENSMVEILLQKGASVDQIALQGAVTWYQDNIQLAKSRSTPDWSPERIKLSPVEEGFIKKMQILLNSGAVVMESDFEWAAEEIGLREFSDLIAVTFW